MTLAELKCGESATIKELLMSQQDQTYLGSMGFIVEDTVVSVRCVGQKGPRIYTLGGSDLAIRIETANLIVVEKC